MSDKVMLTSQFTGLVISANFALSLPISPLDAILLQMSRALFESWSVLDIFTGNRSVAKVDDGG